LSDRTGSYSYFASWDKESFYLIGQRLLAFDEPSSKMARLKKVFFKQKISELPLNWAYQWPQDSADLLFTLALAISDFESFYCVAFAQVKPLIPVAKSGGLREIVELFPLLDIEKLSDDERLWLSFLLAFSYCWAQFFEIGSNGAEFVRLKQAYHQAKLICQSEITPPNFKVLFEQLRLSLKPAQVLLVEGQSEAIFLPHVASVIGKSFEERRVFCLPCGGAKQVLRKYLALKDVVKQPLFCLLDGDVEDSALELNDALREGDILVSLSVSELEAAFTLEQLLLVVDNMLESHGQKLTAEEILSLGRGPRKESLNRIFKGRSLGDFDKLEFARRAREVLTEPDSLPLELKDIVALL
jgi:hypothetical protein